MNEVSVLTVSQFQLVFNILNLTVAIFGGFALLFALASSTVAPAYRLGVAVMTAVFAVAGYHYLRILTGALPLRLRTGHTYLVACPLITFCATLTGLAPSP